MTYPADLYLEGSDQYRGWFNSSITTSVAVNGIAPYKAVLSQGFVQDAKGRKFSKSLGNGIAPKDVTKQYGADILRLWVASVDNTSDVRVSMDLIGQTSEAYRKIRNTLRFLIANTSDFDKTKDAVAFEELKGSDKYLLVRLNQVIQAVREAYDRYNFMEVYRTIFNFLTNDLSAFYLDFAKDIVYIETANSTERRRMQTVMYAILVKLTKLLVPIIPHTAEEIWTYLEQEEEAYAYLTEMPSAELIPDAAEMLDFWSAFLEFRTSVHKALEMSRDEKVIGKSLEASVTVYPDEATRVLLASVAETENVATLLIVSEFIVSHQAAPENAVKVGDTALTVAHASGEVCQRCRRIDETVGTNAHPHLAEFCDHCASIVAAEFPDAVAEGFEVR